MLILQSDDSQSDYFPGKAGKSQEIQRGLGIEEKSRNGVIQEISVYGLAL